MKPDLGMRNLLIHGATWAGGNGTKLSGLCDGIGMAIVSLHAVNGACVAYLHDSNVTVHAKQCGAICSQLTA